MWGLLLRFTRTKLLLAFLCITINALVSNTYAQNELSQKYVRVDTKLMTLHTMLTTIYTQTGIHFCFVDNGVSNISIKFSKNVQRIRVDSLLAMFCPVANVEYAYLNGQIVLRKMPPKVKEKAAKAPKLNETSPAQPQLAFKNNEAGVRYDTIVKTVIDTVYMTQHDTIRVIVRDTVFRKVNVPKIIFRYVPLKNVSVGAYFSPGYSLWHKYTAKGGNRLASDSMNQHQQILLSWEAGADVRITKKNFLFSVGVSYSQLNSELRYMKKTESLQSSNYWQTFTKMVWGIKGTYIEVPSGLVKPVWDSIPVKDSVQVTRTDTAYSSKRTTQSNSYQYIDIPFTLGYTFLKNKRLLAYGLAGVRAGVLVGATGKHFDSNGLVVETDLTHLSTFRLGYCAGLGATYSITNELSLWGDFTALCSGMRMYSGKLNYSDTQVWSAFKFGIRYML